MDDVRDGRGRFAVGNPGGPGRPPGKTHAGRLREILGDEKVEQLVQDTCRRALEGNVHCARRTRPATGATAPRTKRLPGLHALRSPDETPLANDGGSPPRSDGAHITATASAHCLASPPQAAATARACVAVVPW